MKKIEAIIRNEKLKEVSQVLEDSGIGGMTVCPVKGFGHHRNGLRDWTLLVIYADEFQVDKTLDLIQKTAYSGQGAGDGKIAVLPIDHIIRISSGEKGASAV